MCNTPGRRFLQPIPLRMSRPQRRCPPDPEKPEVTQMDASERAEEEHIAVLRALPKPDLVRLTICAGRMLQHPDAMSDGLENELREFIDQVDNIDW
jgi:hypothetical protein